MRNAAYLGLLCSLALTAQASQYQTGQAAVAVIGQPTFSARESGLNPIALSEAGNQLYVADKANKVAAYDVSRVPAGGLAPVAVTNQSVIPGVSSVSVSGKSVAMADAARHRVLIWRDAASDSAVAGPDVVLSDASLLAEPLSVALDGQRLFVGDGALHRVLIWNSVPRSSDQAPDAVLGGPSDGPTATSIGRPVALESDGQRLFVADSAYHRVLVFMPGDVPLNGGALLNSASLLPGPLAPGTLVTIGAAGFADAEESAPEASDQPLPRKLAGVEVILDGQALPLLSVSPTEIRAQLSYAVSDRTAASLLVRAEAKTSTALGVALASATPGLFAFAGKEPRPGMAFSNNAPVTQSNPAFPGETVTLWAAGLGVVTAPENMPVRAGTPAEADFVVQSPISATVNGEPAEVVSAILPEGSTGIYEVRIKLPAAGTPGDAVLAISQESHQSNSVIIPLKNAIQ